MKTSTRSLLRTASAWTAAVLVAAWIAAPLAAQTGEPDVEKLLRQGDGHFQKSEYKLAIGCYLEASTRSRSRMNLSAAYFGLALCGFYERDMASAVKWMRRTSEVDPQKEIAEGLYPKSFVDLFKQVQKETRVKAGEETPVPPPPAVKNEPERIVVREEPKREEPKREAAAVPVQAPNAPAPAPQASVPVVRKGGRFEVSVHTSSWTINPIMSMFEGKLMDELSEELQTKVVKKLSQTYGGLVKAVFTPTLSLESSGSNTGLEFRYYARGWAGTFSIGAAIETTSMELAMNGSAEQTFTNGAVARVEAQARVKTSPASYNFSFRWEIGRARVRPFISFGLGFAPLEGTFDYSYNGSFTIDSTQDTIEDAQTETLKELGESIDFSIPESIVIIQVLFGIKVDIIKGFSVQGEAGIWDGLLLRAGLAYRF